MSTALIADEFWHLAHNVSGRPLLGRRTLPIGLASALLAELLDAGCITVDAGLVTAAAAERAYDTVSTQLIGVILHERVHPVSTWLSVIGRIAPELVRQRLDGRYDDNGRVPGGRAPGRSGLARVGLARRSQLSPTAMRLKQGALAHAWSTPSDAVLAALAWATGLDAIIMRGSDTRVRQFHEDSRAGLLPALRTLAADTYRTVGMIGVSYTVE